jgi:hypothetical protein
MSIKIKVALAQDFLANMAKIPSGVQSKILKWALAFQADPTATGINYEKIKQARDKNLRSVRIDQDWRGIVFKPDKGDVYVLMYVDKHDDAYRWAENKRIAVNPVTGAMQVFATENIIEPALQLARQQDVPEFSTAAVPAKDTPKEVELPYASLTDKELLSLGVPEEVIKQVRTVGSEAELDALQPFLPVEAYEGLFLVLAGDKVSDILVSRETRVDRKIDVEDFAAALQTPESQAHFVVVDDEETMAAILNAPLAQWRVFLHPTQRKLASGNRGGPSRVLGGAGTGKTVLAMHRAKWIAEHALEPGKRVFFTTFTKNLAIDIKNNLSTLCQPSVAERIEVINLDSWVHSFLRRHKYEYRIVYGRKEGGAQDAWGRAKALADSSLGLPADFYEEELEQVVLAQGVSTKDEYRQAKRAGRGTILNRAKRDAIWPVFEEYRAGLTARKLKEVEDAYRDAASLIKAGDTDFGSIIVDETQDFGPQALKLLRAMVPESTNDLFFVGDGNQRIYRRNRSSMRACGIDIRGRAKKLYLNYRTTEEIRRAAVAILEGCEADDLDEGADEVKRYKSISHGAKPVTMKEANLEGAFAKINGLMKVAVEQGRHACVIVPTRQVAGSVLSSLRSAGLTAKEIRPEEGDEHDSNHIRVATMHRAKGLEFDEVILLDINGVTPGGATPDDVLRLHYVALTRAKKLATLIRVK